MKKVIISTIVSLSVFAESNYNLVVDAHLSPYSGADNLIVAHHMLEDLKLTRFGKDIFSKTATLEKVGRFSELFFFWSPINYATMVTQHEVFGHGYRVRSLRNTGAKVKRYKIGVPPPYGPGGGLTAFKADEARTSVFQGVVLSSGGVESTSILANRLRMQWLKDQKIPHTEASLYCDSQQDLTLYILVTQEYGGGDIAEYAWMVGRAYGDDLKLKLLKRRAYINFLDPFTLYSVYSGWNYVLRGTDVAMPMIPIGSYKYLPALRMGLTPFGPEYYLENFLTKEGSQIYCYLRNGSFAGHRYAGVGIEYPSAWRYNTLSLGFRMDGWMQPALNLGRRGPSVAQFASIDWEPVQADASRFGIAASLICQKKLWDSGSIFLQAGGKSRGYVPGEALSSGLILRVGVTLW